MRRVVVRLKERSYPIDVGPGVLSTLGAVARAHLPAEAARVAIVSNPSVFALYGADAAATLRGAGFAVSHWLMGDGERFKSLRTAERCLRFLSESKLERADAVVALGGGVVGDLAGFAASVYLRGVAFLQVPTTLLAQFDSSVGGKTGVNTRACKNLVGAFHQPRAVVVDTDTLRTLPRRELTAGWCEALKQGAVGDRRLFERTRRFLERGPRREEEEESRQGVHLEEELAEIVAAQCAFKARIVVGDEREDLSRTDARSRRVLNFGHTVGHALEAVTNYRRFRHGEAVGHGMIAASYIANEVKILSSRQALEIEEVVRSYGALPKINDLGCELILKAM